VPTLFERVRAGEERTLSKVVVWMVEPRGKEEGEGVGVGAGVGVGEGFDAEPFCTVTKTGEDAV
jgi:hypothetical protein